MGMNITKGLKKVDKTKKRPPIKVKPLRKKPKPAPKKAVKKAKTPVKNFNGKDWIIEHWDKTEITLTEDEVRQQQQIIVANVSNSTLQI